MYIINKLNYVEFAAIYQLFLVENACVQGIYLSRMSFRILGDLIFLFKLPLKTSHSQLYGEFLMAA